MRLYADWDFSSLRTGKKEAEYDKGTQSLQWYGKGQYKVILKYFSQLKNYGMLKIILKYQA